MNARVFLADFRPVPTRYKTPQQDVVAWLAWRHASSALMLGVGQEEAESADVEAFYQGQFDRYGCSSSKIAFRGFEIDDLQCRDPERMEIYGEGAYGAPLHERQKKFESIANRVFETSFYPDTEDAPPDGIVHVTCTGYISPSAAQRIVERRRWNAHTTVTHSYHMGCYGAFPAVRMATGFLGLGLRAERRVDLAHTEICSLHLNPSLHTPEQFVVQSLFADGLIRYSAVDERELIARGLPGFEVLAMREEIVPNSLDAMTWVGQQWGHHLTLSERAPVHIRNHLKGTLERLFEQRGMCFATHGRDAIFAIHPGGPRIIHLVEDALELCPEQTRWSHEVLLGHGNMSSATAPHIWAAIAKDPAVPAGTRVVTMAFGPGLMICAGLFEKV